MKILARVFQFLRGSSVRRIRVFPDSRGESRRRLATARAQARDYDALGWR